MSNALTDYYTDPDKVHQLFRALTDFYKVLIKRSKIEQKLESAHEEYRLLQLESSWVDWLALFKKGGQVVVV